MLSPADRALAARDPALPGLSVVLDADALRRRADLPELTPVYLRYKPGTSCVAGLVPPDGSLAGFAAMAYPPARYGEVRSRTEWQEGPDPVLFLDDLCVAVVPLSRDRGLKAARRLSDPLRRASYLARLGLTDARLTLLRYKPGRRLVLRADGPAGPIAVVKSYTKRDFAGALTGALHASVSGGAPLAGVEADRRTIATAWIDGHPLCPGVPCPADMRRTGSELARLHALPFRPPRRLDARAEARDLRAGADALALLLPEHGDRARGIAGEIASRLSPPAAPSAVHGDFSADQVVLQDGRPVVLDWDRIATGDPGRDLGTFLAALEAQVLDGILSPPEAEAAGAALVEGYAATAGEVPGSVRAQHARALFALAVDGFRDRQTDWPRNTEAVLARVEALLRGSRRPAAKGSPTEGLREALDSATMRWALAAALTLPEGDVAGLGIRLLRHKPGRRALIRYEVSTVAAVEPLVLLGKLRAKGPDRRTPALHTALRAAGLDGSAPHRVGVAPSLGAVERPAIWLQPVLPGRTLSDILATGSASAAAERVGRALAALHGTRVTTDRAWSMADELAVLDRALGRAAAAIPARRGVIERVAAAAREGAERLGESEPVGLHRDFYPDQVLIADETTWLLDLDLYAIGDPAIDLGNFLAHLTELGLRRHGDPSFFAPQAEAFLQGYASLRGPMDRERVETLHWVSLARHIDLSLALPGRRHTTETIMELCDAALGGAGERPARPAPLALFTPARGRANA